MAWNSITSSEYLPQWEVAHRVSTGRQKMRSRWICCPVLGNLALYKINLIVIEDFPTKPDSAEVVDVGKDCIRMGFSHCEFFRLRAPNLSTYKYSYLAAKNTRMH